jgi:outer membrane protein OmpA-like peptidoglycan-associated protein
VNHDNHRRRSLSRLSTLVTTYAAVTALAGCATVTAPAATADDSGQQVVLLESATATEPRPAVTVKANQLLRAAAESPEATNGRTGKSSAAVVTAADGGSTTVFSLTPRRGDGTVEHGFNRPTLIDDNLGRVAAAVTAVRATRPGLDLLAGIDNATRGMSPATLVVISSGLSTAGGFDLRQVGWLADPAAIAAQLRQRNLLPDLGGWHVLFTSLGATAGAQPPLPKPNRNKVIAYWMAMCTAAGAASCDIDNSQVPATPPAATAAMPIVPIPGVTSVTGPDSTTTYSITDATLGFSADSAALSPAALDLLRYLADQLNGQLADRPQATVTVIGHTADPPGSTDADRYALSLTRARAVAAALTSGGLAHPITAVGGGTAPGRSATNNGRFDETRATQMRRVDITY